MADRLNDGFPSMEEVAPSLFRSLVVHRPLTTLGRLGVGVVAGLFFLSVLMTIALPLLSVAGFPVRSLIILTLTILIALARQDVSFRVIRRERWMIFLLIGLGTLGGLVSSFNPATPTPDIIRSILEIHVQSIVNLLLAVFVVEICGVGLTLTMFIGAIGLSALFAVLQFIDVSVAWDARQLLANVQHEVFEAYGFFHDKRPMGLSYSPITLATQVCLVFAAYTATRERLRSTRGRKPFDPAIVMAVLAFIVTCFASGNRSPILGALIFLTFYTLRRPQLIVVSLPVLIVCGFVLLPAFFDTLQRSGSRVASVDDDSAAGRLTLSYYGLLLFLDRPFGYGLGFDPTLYWSKYWADLVDMPNPFNVQVYPLHNYVLSMLNFYGIGIFFLAPLFWKALKPYARYAIFFIPYVVHILFHNAGIFWNDPVIWFMLPLLVSMNMPAPSQRQRFRRRTPGNRNEELRARGALDQL